MAHEGDAHEHEVTQCLIEVDANLFRAIENGGRLLKEVRAYDERLRAVARSLSVWSALFGSMGAACSKPPAARRPPPAARGAEADESALSAEGGLPPTPKMPVFSKSFAKTPMGKRLGGAADESFSSADSGASLSSSDLGGSFLGQLSPATAHIVGTYRTPRAASSGEEGEQQQHEQQQVLQHQHQQQHEQDVEEEEEEAVLGGGHALDISGISRVTPATPDTPEDGDYGPASVIKSVKSAHKLLFGATPVTEVLLASGTRRRVGSEAALEEAEGAVNISRASSNPATPTLLSPFAAAGSADTADAADTPSEELLGGAEQQQRARSAAHDEGSVDKNVPINYAGNASKGGPAATAPAPRSAKSAEPKSILKKREALAGTPLSRSVASKRRRSLSGAEPDEAAPLHGDDEALLDASHLDEGEPGKEFSLALFPRLFQSGEGAAQVTAVYSQFGKEQALSLPQLMQRLPSFSKARVELMLDMLVSRGLLRPFQLDDQLLWRMPTLTA